MKTGKWLRVVLITRVIFIAAACGPLQAQSPLSPELEETSPVTDSSEMKTGIPDPDESLPPQSTGVDHQTLPYAVVDTGQNFCYSESEVINCPRTGEDYHGQDAQYSGPQPALLDNEDGTIADLVTGLMWTASPDLDGDGQIDPGDKRTYTEAVQTVDALNQGEYAGYQDWRLPTIKELYSLIDFRGLDPSGQEGNDATGLVPFIDTEYFDFAYGDTSSGERVIDAQFLSRTLYVGDANLVFGVNFADGRIKGYGLTMPGGGEKTFYIYFVRGNVDYGQNEFIDNRDGTISDLATGLTWTKQDSGEGMDWGTALDYCQNLDSAGSDDWRLPNVKELQSIVDYARSPSSTGSPAVDPIFQVSIMDGENGQEAYPYYWSSTTHANTRGGTYAAYVAFGEAPGYMHGEWIDVHGAGAQRSDPKTGDPGQFLIGHGPQGDAVRIENYVRCVRGGTTELSHSTTLDQETLPAVEEKTFQECEPGDVQMPAPPRGSNPGLPE